ncbi:MAG: RrF2 family transcriptional regulator [Geminicoccaceae bacterium]
MRLSLNSDYSIRMLSMLATNAGELVTIAEIAQRFDISVNHLMKVANRLGQLGYIETLRGRHGGLRLARAAEEISIGEVIRHTETDFAMVECFAERGGCCVIAGPCRFQAILEDARDAFLAVLDRHSLADLTTGNCSLCKLLEATRS